MNSYGAEFSKVAGFCESGNEISGFGLSGNLHTLWHVVRIVSQLNQVHTLVSLFKIHFNIILHLFLQILRLKFVYAFLISSACYTLRPSGPLKFYHPTMSIEGDT